MLLYDRFLDITVFVLFCFSFSFLFFNFFCSFCTIILKKLDMVCCAWNLNIFNNETSFYEAKKQQKCHDILRMSHCILWCHFHCIWWINKWWKKMLMRFVDMAFIPRHSLSLCVCASRITNKLGLLLWIALQKAKKSTTTHKRNKGCTMRRTPLQHWESKGFCAIGSHHLCDSKYWSSIKERNSDPAAELLNSSCAGLH